jgi:hypothetical protein
MSGPEEAEAALLQAQVMAAALERRIAERELSDLGITASGADITAWLSASDRERRRLTVAWVTLVADGGPAWKAR